MSVKGQAPQKGEPTKKVECEIYAQEDGQEVRIYVKNSQTGANNWLCSVGKDLKVKVANIDPGVVTPLGVKTAPNVQDGGVRVVAETIYGTELK